MNYYTLLVRLYRKFRRHIVDSCAPIFKTTTYVVSYTAIFMTTTYGVVESCVSPL